MEEEEINGTRRVRYLLRHEIFSKRPSDPCALPMNKLRTLRFYSLWNQAVAAMLNMLNPDIYHSVDFHAALAPLYMKAETQVPMVLVLHASHMGVIESDLVSDRFWKTVSALRRLSLIFNLKVSTLREYCICEGRFNMLQAGVAYIHEVQAGYGLCASHRSLRREHAIFSGLRITPLDPLLRDNGVPLEELRTMRVEAKTALQRHCRLEEDPGAKILVLVSFWVKKIDIAALAAEILSSNTELQIVFDLAKDACDLLAQESVASITLQFQGRIFLNKELPSLPEDLLKGADFVLLPPSLELCFTDVDFAMLGVPTIGCAKGRLGQMPGVYYCQQNGDNKEMLMSALFYAVQQALTMTEDTYWQLATAGTQVVCSAEVWREKLLEAYTLAQRSFRHKGGQQGHLWRSTVSEEDLQRAMAPRRSSSLRPISSTAALVHQMQVLDIDDDAEFLTQPVSETRAHTIMKAVAATPHSHGAVQTDAKTMDSDIIQAAERLRERNAITRWLMKQCGCGLCLRIHSIIGLCYVFVPMGELVLTTVEVQLQEGSLASKVQWSTYFAGAALGCCVWLGLSGGIPPNLLMAISQAINLALFVLMPSMASGVFESDLSYTLYLLVSGVQSSSRLLFLIWNFSENEAGFQVAIWRLGLLEGLRAGIAWLAVALSFAGMDFINKQVTFAVSFTTLILLFKAPDSYSFNVLPKTGIASVLRRPTFLLLLASEVTRALSGYAVQDITHWLSLNGWEPSEVRSFAWLAAGLLPLVLGLTSASLRRLSVWGPWAMRDFACLLPPASLLRSLALYDLGHRNYRSLVFVAAMMLSVWMELTRFIAVWSAMMTVLQNRWYALKGCYICLFFVMVASACSPWLSEWQAMKLCGSSPFGPVMLEQSSEKGLGEATAWAVVPLSLLSYVFQLLALPGFNEDVPSFKGSSRFSSSWKHVRVAEVKNLRSLARLAKFWQGQSDHDPEASSHAFPVCEDESDAVASEHESLALPSLSLRSHERSTEADAEVRILLNRNEQDALPELTGSGDVPEVDIMLERELCNQELPAVTSL